MNKASLVCVVIGAICFVVAVATGDLTYVTSGIVWAGAATIWHIALGA